jgi:hypothetical protein
MAKAATKRRASATKKKDEAVKPNLFAKAKDKKAAAPAKAKKGTTFVLPKDLDDEGKLRGESKVLNEAIHTVIEAKVEEKTATNKANVAKGALNPYVNSVYVAKWAALGIQPPTPIGVTNHTGETLTFVIMDKTSQNTLNGDQVELLQALLGEDACASLVETVETYSLDSETMREQSNDDDLTVQDVVFDVISEAIMNDPRLTDEQKGSLISQSEITRVKPGNLARLAEFAGSDAAKIASILEVIGSGCPRYLKS